MYSELVREHFQNPRHAGRPPHANAVGASGAPGAGNFMVIALRVEAGRIVSAGFETYGCPAAIACGSCLSDWVVGLRAEAAQQITEAELECRLGGLPLGRSHCATLAVEALRRALAAANPRAEDEA